MAPKNNGVALRNSKWPPKTIVASLEIAKCTGSETASAARMYSHRTNHHIMKQMQAMWAAAVERNEARDPAELKAARAKADLKEHVRRFGPD